MFKLGFLWFSLGIMLITGCTGKTYEEIRISLIVSASRETIEQAMSELETGQEFGQVARNYSDGPNKDDGGDIGFMKTGDLRDTLKQEAGRLKVGEYSGIISENNTYYIIKKTDTRTVKVPLNLEKYYLPAPLAIISFFLVMYIFREISYHSRNYRVSFPMKDGSHLIVYTDLSPSQQDVDISTLSGARIVIFEYCISVLFMTFRNPSYGYLIRQGQRTFPRALPYILISLFFGWWGFPWGPIYTISSIGRNLSGGIKAGIIRNEQVFWNPIP
jgi:hypothetical protein